jgi:hypothetical protein
MWPFKKRKDPVSIRLASLACDVSFIYQRLSQHERFMNYELLDLVHKIDKRVSDLEKILKSCNVRITIVEKK